VLLRSQPLMRIVGFNGTQIRNGTSQRGKKNSSPPPTSNQNAENNTQDTISPTFAIRGVQNFNSLKIGNKFY
jgi:hypothetical protein